MIENKGGTHDGHDGHDGHDNHDRPPEEFTDVRPGSSPSES